MSDFPTDCTHPREAWVPSHTNPALVECEDCELLVRDADGVPLNALACGVFARRFTEAEAKAILAAELYVESMNDEDRPAWSAIVAEARARRHSTVLTHARARSSQRNTP